ncbi:unnamed protein product [Candidula unifasciata]|uniref:Dermatopontin n=1 Tax=Candidula unifasciata TaxID=100452 RepID=A0A8S3YJK4_9EUPU|nr:unnamed protein product [Candidula unifasciata]
MASFAVTILLAVVWTLSASGQWVNNFDQVATFECTHGRALYLIRSIHDNYFEDRIWQFKCRTAYTTTSCFWTEFLNLWDQTLDYNCPGDNYINGIYSVHDNYYEDRRFSVKCCAAGHRPLKWCYLTDYINDWDGEMYFEAPGGYVIRGLQSHHDNSREDRRWKINLCWVV